MNVLISGATGLVGSALTRELEAAGHSVVSLTRGPAGPKRIHWDPQSGQLNPAELESVDAVVHLAGESIASGRWTAEKKARIRDSRVRGTALLAQTLANLPRPPRVLVSASAIGYYGSRGDEILTEASSSGTGFLAEVCRDWERATAPAEQAAMRVAYLRFGVILSRNGGALRQMLLPFKLGLGGRIGDGRQYMSWIALDDTTAAVRHVLDHESIRGGVNVVTPNPVTNYEFTKALGRALRRPTIFPMPAFAARLAFGEMADELLLSSARVEPGRLRESAFTFRYPLLEEALEHTLKPPAATMAATATFSHQS